MRSTLLAYALLLGLATLLAQPPASGAFSWWRGQRRQQPGRGRRMEVTCSQVKPHEVCDGTNSGFQVSDGCNMCTCGGQAGKLTCSIKSCPREDELTTPRARRRAGKFCAKLAKKVQKRLRKFQKAKSPAAGQAGSSADQQSWPIKCFKERKLCRDRPGVAFFDGCNRCRCPEQAAAAAAQCETANVCPDFVGSRKEFKRHCRTLGARIEGGGGAGGSGGGGGGSGGGGRKRGRDRRVNAESSEVAVER